MNRTHTNGELRIEDVGKSVTLCGWVAKRRNLGSICFIDLRDRYGITQVIFDETMSEKIKDVRNEYVLEVKGTVQKKDVPNKNLATGEIEVHVEDVKILNSAKTTPMIIADKTDALEDLRLKYRYLDLRRKAIYDNLIVRDKVETITRDYLHKLDFIEVETPILSKSTPEGARDYLVPSRLYKGKFYALPQSPQIYKQLLMIGGLDRYFQIARCFRDEDLRADRQPEFTQIDIEMSFADEEDIFHIVEGLMSDIFKGVKDLKIDEHFERLSYDDAMRYYGSDKPDLRFGMRLCDLDEVFKETAFSIFKKTLEDGGLIKGLKAEGLAEKYSRKDLDHLQEFVKIYKAKALAWLKYTSEGLSGSIAKFMSDEEKDTLIAKMDLHIGDIVFMIADEKGIADVALGALRTKVAKDNGLIPEDEYKFVWITDFPMFEYSKEQGIYVACHHPFTAPHAEDVDKLLTDKGNCYSRAYDLVLNGYELLSGSVRIHDQDMQEKVFEALGLTKEEAKEKFGFFLEAFEYGAPPHLGVGIGVERLVMILCGTDNIKDVVAFPKTASAMCLMSEAPNTVDDAQLQELKIKIA